MSVNRKATVTQIDTLNRLGLVYYDSGLGGVPPARPFMGSETTGFHTAPPQGSTVLVLHEIYDFPIGTISVPANPQNPGIPTLNPGESYIRASDGRIVGFLKSDGTITVFSKPSGPSMTVDNSGNVTITCSGKINLNATGGVWSNGTQIVVP